MRLRTVLLVGYSPDERRMYADYLRQLGFRVIAIENPADALALARTADLVVTDLWLDGRYGGVEFIHRVRQGDRTTVLPIVVVTAYPLEEQRRRALAAGCNTFLLKPCLPDALGAEIHRLLGSEAAATPRG